MMTKAFLMIGVFCLLVAQTQAQDKVKVELKDGPKPDIYIDGKKYDNAIFDLLDQTKIESIVVIKGDQALKEYHAENGVVLVVTKQSGVQIRKAEKEKTDSDEKPLIIIDGEIADEEDLAILNREDVKSIEVLKDKEALDQYKAPNGVVIITTKQK